MKKVLFICHGNICRSPMAEYIFKDMVKKAGLADMFEIASAATSREEIENDIYPPAKKVLDKHNISYERRHARQINAQDMEYYDYIVVMEEYNKVNLRRLFPDKDMSKVRLLMSYAGRADDVSDPWYTRDFEKAYSDIEEGCRGLFKELTES